MGHGTDETVDGTNIATVSLPSAALSAVLTVNSSTNSINQNEGHPISPSTCASMLDHRNNGNDRLHGPSPSHFDDLPQQFRQLGHWHGLGWLLARPAWNLPRNGPETAIKSKCAKVGTRIIAPPSSCVERPVLLDTIISVGKNLRPFWIVLRRK